MGNAPTLVLFRSDLRTADHPALWAAAETGAPVVPVYVLDESSGRGQGGAARWWLHGSLRALGDELRGLGAPLVLRRGETSAVVADLARAAGARAVHFTRAYDGPGRAAETALREALQGLGIAARRFAGSLLFEPETVRTKDGGPYRVFTPFWRACRAAEPPKRPLPAPVTLRGHDAPPASDRLEDWGLRPSSPDWATGLAEVWTPGEAAARERLAALAEGGLAGYRGGRDRPDREGTSRLSPHLRFGEIGPHTVWHAIAAAAASGGAPAGDAEAWLRELGWRDFCHHLAFENPDMAETPLRGEFAAMPWREDEEGFTAWTRGRTGFPIVDAGMRQLWRTGWMHNRVRMVAASFLVKDLLVPWQRGEAWFRDTLVDACPANNPANWQWVAGCGADAAPFFRIFNPVAQGLKFDPDGNYVRRWVPELRDLPGAAAHEPWDHPGPCRRYPAPLVDHKAARRRALAAFEQVKEAAR